MNVARAVARAESLLNATGRVVVCCDLDHVTPGVQQLISDDDDSTLQMELLGSDFEDAFAAAVIRSVQSRRSVYLLSQLAADQIEDLGFAHISSPHDIERLAQGAGDICVIHTSQF
jgi:siroheme synthase (precorrin-2 oxidase/ferrochelatase)